MGHEGVATACLFELFAGGRRMTSEQRIRAVAACQVLASTAAEIRKPFHDVRIVVTK